MTRAQRTRGPGARAGLAALLAAALAALPARAASTEPLPVTLSVRGSRVEATIDLSTAFAPAMEHQLGNGLTNVVAVYVSVVPEGGGAPVALYGRVVDILFDVWEEAYAVTVHDPGAPQGTRLVLRDFGALRAYLAHEGDLDLGPAAGLPARFVVEARVEVNPISKEQLQRTREFIANPSGGSRVAGGGGGSRSVLGAMASFLLREPDPGTDVHLFRSRPFGAREVLAR